MVDETEIRCVLTDLQGRNSDHLNILSGTVEQLMGVGRGEGNPLADVVDRVRASAVIPLTEPEPYTMLRILDFASTEDLSPLSGAVITMRDGWTEDVFQTNQTVCLVPEELVTDETETLTVQEQGFEPRDLTIVGTVRNLKEKAIYCPFLMRTHRSGFHNGQLLVCRSRQQSAGRDAASALRNLCQTVACFAGTR